MPSYVYVGTQSGNLHKVTDTLVTDDTYAAPGAQAVRAIAEDADFVYISVAQTLAANVDKIQKSNMTLIASSTDVINAANTNQNSLVQDDDYVYLGTNAASASSCYIQKILKSDMSITLQELKGGGSTAQFWALLSDGTHIIRCLQLSLILTTSVGHYEKSNLGDAHTAFSYGDSTTPPYCLGSDTDNNYVGGDLQTVQKRTKISLALVAETVDLGGAVQDIYCDGGFVFACCGTTNLIKKIQTSDMSVIATSANLGTVPITITGDSDFLYVGAGTTLFKLSRTDLTTVDSVDLSETILVVSTNGVVDAAEYPTDAVARVTSLIHRYSPGNYTLEINIGEVVADFGLPQISPKPQPSITPDEPFDSGELPEKYGTVPNPWQPPAEDTRIICPIDGQVFDSYFALAIHNIIYHPFLDI